VIPYSSRMFGPPIPIGALPPSVWVTPKRRSRTELGLMIQLPPATPAIFRVRVGMAMPPEGPGMLLGS
jgi:hypothetical protein